MIRIISVLQHGNFFLFFEKKGRWCSTKKKNAKTRHKTGGGLQLTGVWAEKWKGQEFFLFFAWPHAHLSISPYIKSPSSIRLIAIHFRIRLFDSVTDLCDVGTKKKTIKRKMSCVYLLIPTNKRFKRKTTAFPFFLWPSDFFFLSFCWDVYLVVAGCYWTGGGDQEPGGQMPVQREPSVLSFFLPVLLILFLSFLWIY